MSALLVGLKSREERRRDVEHQREGLQERATRPLDRGKVQTEVSRRLEDWRGLCGWETPQARKLLETVLAGRIVFTPTAKAGLPAYEARAPLTFERMFAGLLPAVSGGADRSQYGVPRESRR